MHEINQFFSSINPLYYINLQTPTIIIYKYIMYYVDKDKLLKLKEYKKRKEEK